MAGMETSSDGPGADLRRRLEASLGRTVESVRRVHGGYTNADRWVLGLNDGLAAFAKVGSDSDTARWLRDEIAVYDTVDELFMPDVLAAEASDQEPFLVLEDLSKGYWPPPWDESAVARVRDTLEAMAGVAAPAWFAPLGELVEGVTGWPDVAADPGPFLSLGLCSEWWLQEALPVLLDSARSADFSGSALVHGDIRSDNLCLMETRVVVIDWDNARAGNAMFDLAMWLPSLEAEGGPPPETLLPNSEGLASFASGYFASRAGLAPRPHAPRVRDVQRAQLLSALPWTIRELGLAPLDGPSAPRE